MKIKHKYTGKIVGGTYYHWKHNILENHVEENYEIITQPDLVDVYEIKKDGSKLFIETTDRSIALPTYLEKSDQFTIKNTDLSKFDKLYRPISSFGENLKAAVEKIMANNGYASTTQDTSEKEDAEIEKLNELGLLQKIKPNQYKLTPKANEQIKNNLMNFNSSSNIIQSENSLNTDVFIVHGHDEIAVEKTARFIAKLGLTPIILHEQASSGKTIIEKIEEYSDVGFGIVLYTPCDLGAKKGYENELKSRARQNVVFEHGYLMGKIGRKNVCALVKGDIETPTDISGVVYVPMDEGNAWQLTLAKELRNSDYTVDMNKL